MTMNCKLEHLKIKREKVRKEVNKIMKSDEYYKNNDLYEKVKALTGLESYLTYAIEKMEKKIQEVYDDYL